MNKTLLFTIDFPPNIGGVANYYFEIYKHLPNNKITVLTQKTNNKDDYSFNIYRKELISFLPIWPRWLPAIFHLYKTIKKEEVSTVLVGQILPLGTIAFLLSKILNIEYVVFTHGFDILKSQKRKRKKYLTEIILKNAKNIIANSNFTKNEIKKLGVKPDKITTLYPCPHIKPPAKNDVKKRLINEYDLKDKKIILSIGRMVKRKGFDTVIKSMNLVTKSVDNAVYIIAGGVGNYENEIRKTVKKYNQKNNITIISNPTNDEIAALYDLCNVFIMPSRKIGADVEGFGIVYLEANLFEKPVIGGASGGVSEAIINDKTGLLVDPESVGEIKDAIVKLLNNEGVAKTMGVYGKKRVDEQFTWNAQVKKLQNIL